jgi:hypothetical protein
MVIAVLAALAEMQGENGTTSCEPPAGDAN